MPFFIAIEELHLALDHATMLPRIAPCKDLLSVQWVNVGREKAMIYELLLLSLCKFAYSGQRSALRLLLPSYRVIRASRDPGM